MGTEHFSDAELACPCCGETYDDDPISLQLLEQLRRAVGPLILNSAHRCPLHNRKVRGAALSLHRKLAFDIRVENGNRGLLFHQAKAVGFTGFGFGQSFLHVDHRSRPAFWFYGPVSEQLWKGLI